MLELQGTISEEGKVSVYNMPALNDWRQKNAGRDIVLCFKIKRRKRSNEQNAYYWGVVIPLMTEAINQLGHDLDEEETHEFLKSRFNTKQVEVFDGHYIDIPQSTRKLDTKDFMDFIDRIQKFAATMLNLYIPSPNEQTKIDYTLNN